MKKTNPSPPQPASYLDRLTSDHEFDLKLDLATFVGSNLAKAHERIFIASGTTAALTGLEILRLHQEVKAWTHSVPFAWHFMEQSSNLKPSANVDVIGGPLNHTTGIVKQKKLPEIQSATFIYAPHGIDKKAVTGNRDIEFLQAAWAKSEKIMMLATPSKLLRKGDFVVKHIGHMKKDTLKRQKSHILVVNSDERMDPSIVEPVNSLLHFLQETGVEIHRAPICTSSPWAHAFPKKRSDPA